MCLALYGTVTSLLFSLPGAKDQAKRPLTIFSFTGEGLEGVCFTGGCSAYPCYT